jgi:4'-phosphopantetheinyl transferase
MPSKPEFDFLLDLLGADEAPQVRRFKFEADQKRALVSRLLQRAAISRVLGIPWADIIIKRTKGQKPFLATPHSVPWAPNFNYNVSHEGSYVALATENLCIAGMDVAAPSEIRVKGKIQTGPESIETWFDSFHGVMTDVEWKRIRGQVSEDLKLGTFRRHWSLKEAFVKARGDGLAFEPLHRAEFHFGEDTWAPEATVKLDGVALPGWKFFLEEMNDHWLTVARAPPQSVIDQNGDFLKTLKERNPTQGELEKALSAPNPKFSIMEVRDLVPSYKVDEYDACML